MSLAALRRVLLQLPRPLVTRQTTTETNTNTHHTHTHNMSRGRSTTRDKQRPEGGGARTAPRGGRQRQRQRIAEPFVFTLPPVVRRCLLLSLSAMSACVCRVSLAAACVLLCLHVLCLVSPLLPVAARSNGLLPSCDLSPVKVGQASWPNGLFGKNYTSGANSGVMPSAHT